MDVVRLDRTPDPLTEDPFAGGNAVTTVGFDGERFAAAGATEDELAELSGHYDTLGRDERRRFTGWLADAPDDQVTEWLTVWRQFVADAEAAAALIDGTVDEVLARVAEAPDEERLDLAQRTLAAEQAQGEDPDDFRSTLVAGLEAIIEAEEQRNATRAQQEALIAGSVGDILAGVGEDKELAARTLEAELALRGDDARTTLVGPLQALVGEGAEQPAAGSEGAGTPEGTETPASGSDSPAAGTPDATP